MNETETHKKKGFSRRKFLVRSSVGLGVILGAGYLSKNMVRRYIAKQINEIDLPYLNQSGPNVWFEVTAGNDIILHSPKVEMGQGAFTGLAQIAAEELGININQMRVVHAPSSSGNIDPFFTGGSTSISGLWQPLRELAATMREMLKNEASSLLNIPLDKLSVEDGIIQGPTTSITYGEVVQKTKEWKVPDTPILKEGKDYKIIGKPVAPVDLHDKVLGAPIFGLDAAMPDMLYGAIVRPVLVGAKYIQAETRAAEKMPGVVKIVRQKDFVGVVATSYTEAENAKEAINVTWRTEKKWETADIEEMILVGKGNPVVIQKKGKAKNLLSDKEGIISMEFKSPIGAHAQLEPNGAVAYVTEDQATIIISTQVVKLTRDEVAKRLGLKKNQVNIQPTHLGGGFGRRLHTPHAIEAAILSKAVGKPVKCIFNRQEEFQSDTFRPPTHHIMKAKLRKDGLIEAIEHQVSGGDVAFGAAFLPSVSAPILGADLGVWRGGMIQYGKIPNYRAVSWRVKLPFSTSWWRGLGLLANTFAIESFMDELAIKAGKDPVQFRLNQIQDDERGFRLKEVIKAAAQKAGWQDGVINGRAMGFAASTDTNTPVAQVAEVSIEEKEIKVHKVTCAIDVGMAVNPDQIRAQCEGGIIMGMSASMHEKMEIIDGALSPTIYGPYKMALMKHAPKEIDVVILENAAAPGAVGEPPIGPIGAAIANAVFRLTGQRLTEMPLELA
jgi:isoquinoline 1-oxidoreductase beta subunit